MPDEPKITIDLVRHPILSSNAVRITLASWSREKLPNHTWGRFQWFPSIQDLHGIYRVLCNNQDGEDWLIRYTRACIQEPDFHYLADRFGLRKAPGYLQVRLDIKNKEEDKGKFHNTNWVVANPVNDERRFYLDPCSYWAIVHTLGESEEIKYPQYTFHGRPTGKLGWRKTLNALLDSITDPDYEAVAARHNLPIRQGELIVNANGGNPAEYDNRCRV